MQKSLRKDYSENLVFINESFNEKLITIRQFFIYSMDFSILNDIDFKKFVHEMNDYEDETESQVFSIIARQSPNSKDLRLLLSILKSINDLQRIGRTIYRVSKVFNKYLTTYDAVDLNLFTNFDEMGKKLVVMLDQIIEISTTKKFTSEKAKIFQEEFSRADDYIDSLFKDIYKLLIKKIDKEVNSQNQAKMITEMLLVVRHLERLGDHLCNIAERILYAETGSRFTIS